MIVLIIDGRLGIINMRACMYLTLFLRWFGELLKNTNNLDLKNYCWMIHLYFDIAYHLTRIMNS